MAKKVNAENIEEKLPDVTIEKLINNEYGYDIEKDNDIDIEKDNDIDVPMVEKPKGLEYNNVNYAGRGFNSLEDAIEYMNSETFNNLGDADKNEFKKWLIKED
ncbi:MAG: hypothetical protein IKY26_02810 [Erysipelotrichaceae bacterium]|nr:hypothetical protein [Erysipelotrichaceae bacterium]